MSKAPHANCHQCPLRDAPMVPTKRAKIVPAKAAIVSRSPGRAEVSAGEPMASDMGSGKIVEFLLNLNGAKRNEVLLTNTVLCVAPEGMVPPEAIKACAPRLDADLRGIRNVLACGKEAVGLLIGRGSIDRHRGYVHDQSNNGHNRRVVASYNPAVILRDDAKFPDIKRDFKRLFNPLPPPKLPKVKVIEDGRTAREYIASLTDTEAIVAADIESRGGLTHTATLISLQLCVGTSDAVVLGEREGIFQDEAFIRDFLRPFFRSTRSRFLWHGGKFDTKVLRHTYGIDARVDHDTLLLSYALDERSGTDERVGVHGLDYLLMDTFGWPHYSSEAIERAKKTGVVEDYDEFYHYAGLDVGGTFQLFEHQWPLAEKDKVVRPYRHLLLDGNEFLTGVEMNGMIYDVDRAMDLHEFVVGPELAELRGEMQRMTGSSILNPASTKQMQHLYYDKWGVQHVMQKRRPTETMQHPERSIDESARKEILAGRFRYRGDQVQERTGSMVRMVPAEDQAERRNFMISFTELYDRFQKLSKQDGTYLVGLTKRAELNEGHKIHTSLNLHGTNSGRLSSSRPNLQNITRSKEGLPDIRKLFRASDGAQIVQADYSQAELRCIAVLSGDRELTRIYSEGLSFHKETAKRFFGEDYTGEQYSTSKNVNFGIFYLQSADTFQEKHGIPKNEAEPYMAWIWKTFTGVKEWHDAVRKEVKEKGVLVSPFGRKRRFHLLTRENFDAAVREGINFYPQSTASDLTLRAGIAVAASVDGARARIGILVHDSIVADVDEDYIEEYSQVVQEVMAATPKDELGWTLPFEAELGVGPTWGEAK